MKFLESDDKHIICSNPDSIFCYFGWPSIARLQDGTLAMTASGFRLKHVCPFGKAIICYSRDEGKTWTRPAAVIDTPLDDRDSGIVPFGNGRVIMTSFNNTVSQQRIWNGISEGEHAWPDMKRRMLSEAYLDTVEELGNEAEFIGSTYKISEDGGYSFGKFHRSPVTAPHGPMRKNDGTLLYVGRRFSADNSAKDDGRPFIQACVLNEADEFVPISGIDNIYSKEGDLLLNCEPHAIQLPNGKIIVHIRVENIRKVEDGGVRYFTIYQSESLDDGRNFTRPHQILGDLGGSPAHLYLHSSGILISAYGYREAPYGIRVMFSKDEGKTWDTDYILSDDGMSGDLGYPCSVGLKDGRICTVYYENIGGESVIMQKIWRIPEEILK